MSSFLTSDNPFMLGFDSFDRMLNDISKKKDSFPPYNIEQIDEQNLQITLAVAGFKEEDLVIDLEDKQLNVRGQHNDEQEIEHNYIYHGIANRSFQRSFVLADGLEVTGAHLEDGLLQIDLHQREPEKTARTIKITKK